MASVALIVTAPVLFICALAIKLTSRGPIFFKQKRVGLQFQLPGSEEVIYAEGELVEGFARLKDAVPEHGVRFTLLTERHRRMITDYVSEHERD